MATCRRDFGEFSSGTKVVDSSDGTKKLSINLSNLTTGQTREWMAADASMETVGKDSTQTITNKTVDATVNTIMNIDNTCIKAGAQIDVAKLANGTVSNAEFQHLAGVTGPIQPQLAAVTPSVDRQMASQTDIISTASSTWIDVDSMTLTTHNLGGTGCYTIRFNANVTTSSSSHEAMARLMIGGVGIDDTETSWVGAPDNTEDYLSFGIDWLAQGVANGTVIKVQMRAVDTSTTAYMQKRRLIIDGVPTSTLV